MSTTWPTFSVIIAARPEQAIIRSLQAVEQLEYPRDRLEVLVVRGRHPSMQRNTALRQASGELVYFLDDDAEPLPTNLQRAAAWFFKDPKLEAVGGPNLCPTDAPELEQVFALVLRSWLAFGPSRARYAPIGPPRLTSEKALILCNLAARRQTLLELGGFDERLYPNEENALLDAIQRRGGRLWYDPELVVYRRPRPDVRAFTRMLLTYGRGRAEQFRRLPTWGSALNFVPPLFLVYLGALAMSAPWGGWPGGAWKGLGWLPLGAYALLLTLQTMQLAAWQPWRRVWRVALLTMLAHGAYGAGFWYGCLTRLRPPLAETAREIRVEIVRSANPQGKS
ncbi:MAG: glycosyltransferase [Verrucomicrobiota bacterium]|nr:glycosyltransferase [Limisphaera sp.]MDW8380992.1 glycosyltransferase [Verrucomicrobiota bacterium]